MADAVLFEFLHTEMVAELWAPDADPGSGSADRITPQHKAGLSGKKKSWSVLEGLGFRVGQALGERLPRETLAVREELDALKFLCKDLWAAMFQKHMDGLRTNHQFLAFTCGLLCGALHTLGFRSLVTASVTALPACKFQVVMQKS
ncbi:trafficking protein particle complex subunit 6A isoform X4 [Mesocricetus auratus]|uniref:Trafficking protein particle complex subunit 6A isoform X4 n=1 Tax=Mesocricetus auratus TaxID=10036 RepID=A0ABM2WIZ4_MESAU|nr:trafficking protein particle complex subunit 6A isoform X4 [Mesocricetus auratus]